MLRCTPCLSSDMDELASPRSYLSSFTSIPRPVVLSAASCARGSMRAILRSRYSITAGRFPGVFTPLCRRTCSLTRSGRRFVQHNELLQELYPAPASTSTSRRVTNGKCCNGWRLIGRELECPGAAFFISTTPELSFFIREGSISSACSCMQRVCRRWRACSRRGTK